MTDPELLKGGSLANPGVCRLRNGRRSQNYSFLFAFALCVLCALPAQGFLIFLHRRITNQALDSFPIAAISASERKMIANGSGDADLVEGGLPGTGSQYEPRFHFDDNFSYEDVARNYSAVGELLEENLAKRRRDPWEFGKILHAFEDFYSHSNYILLYRQYKLERGELVGSIPVLEEVMLAPGSYSGFISLLHADLHTGRYPNHAFIPNDTDHGKFVGPGMHKDAYWRDYYTEAFVTASRAAIWHLNLYCGDTVALSNFKTIKAKGFLFGI
jgi:hypothetical protein